MLVSANRDSKLTILDTEKLCDVAIYLLNSLNLAFQPSGLISIKVSSTFLHSKYGGSDTLLVDCFIDMVDAVNERGLPGGPQAARAAVKWTQDHVDKDWKEWTGDDSNW
ncbi:protein PLASTID REDOX INSENSITIVE 2 [Sesbania bispinosa]|nr:protein PLASTID REDOX INSENSITIVE 2 [Sesbania bispinosa]